MRMLTSGSVRCRWSRNSCSAGVLKSIPLILLPLIAHTRLSSQIAKGTSPPPLPLAPISNPSHHRLPALGANVIATAGSADKLEVCKKYGGADYAINYRTDGWQKEVLKLTKGKGVGAYITKQRRREYDSDARLPVDVIYDPVGLIKDSLKCIAWKGRAIVVGFAAGDIEKVRGIPLTSAHSH